MRHAHEQKRGLRRAVQASSAAAALLLVLTGCPEGDGEQFGKQVDDVAEDVKDTTEDAVDSAEDVVDDANDPNNK